MAVAAGSINLHNMTADTWDNASDAWVACNCRELVVAIESAAADQQPINVTCVMVALDRCLRDK